MKLYLDTNVVIDVIAMREPFFQDSQAVIGQCECGKDEGIISTLTLCTVSYVLRKFAREQMKRKLQDFRNILVPVDLSVSIIDKAIGSTLPDFEDAVQFYTAVYSDADYIITRNAKHFPQDSIPVLSPTAFLALK